ncbi:transcription initiation factor IIB, variant 3 [Coprinopsis cinerea AmutBmut pab1-1]|nr:transcription initiation factor IIB, variant 3 [Coprinopsis cinerea AmutBmut pab1-1]
MTVCNECGGSVIEYDHAAGNGFCIQCGTVVEENLIVNEIVFGETSNGAAIVQGSFVAQGATHARMSGPYGNRGSTESREQTIANANKKIQSIANVLRLNETVCLAATRLYTLAVEHKFTKGRKSLNVVAVCLYVACRQKETKTYMLIDFSDLLQVNVFELGHTYLQLVQTLNLRLPLVDPSHYISRFAALLEFGDETHKVATDAVRLVQRFDRDWMTRGRRPAGICGAALLLAARMNNFRRSVEEIVQVVKIADTTLKKRLDEFKATPSGSLTLADFRNVWLEDEMDPPAFTKGREKEEAERLAREREENGEVEVEEPKKGKKKKAGKSRKGKRKRGDEEEELEEVTPAPQVPQPFDPSLIPNGILEGAIQPEIDLSNIDPVLLQQDAAAAAAVPPLTPSPTSTLPPPPSTSELEETISNELAEEVQEFLQNDTGTKLSEALDAAEQARLANITAGDELSGLDEEELDRFILSEQEVKIKERVWVELNREYLEALAGHSLSLFFIFIDFPSRLTSNPTLFIFYDAFILLTGSLFCRIVECAAKGDQTEPATKSRKRRKTNNKPRDASTPAGGTAAESVRNLIKKNPKYSKRINYDALKDLFVDGGPASSAFGARGGGVSAYGGRNGASAYGNGHGHGIGGGIGGGMRNPGADADDKDDEGGEGLIAFDDDKEEPGEGGLVIIDEGVASVVGPPGVAGAGAGATIANGANGDLDADADGDEDGSDDEKDDEGDVGGWEDAWEQEV